MATSSSFSSEYGIATNLKGFGASTLRVRIERREMGLVWVRTADLRDAGTPLVLPEAQVAPEAPETDLVHRDGFVTFAA